MEGMFRASLKGCTGRAWGFDDVMSYESSLLRR